MTTLSPFTTVQGGGKASEAMRALSPGGLWAPFCLEWMDADEEDERRRMDRDAALDALPALAASLPALVAELRAERVAVACEPLPQVPVSVSRAAKLLGRSKSRTLRPAIDARNIRTVRQGTRLLIPPDELRRLAAEGLGPARPPPRRQRAPPATAAPPGDLADELARVSALRRRR
jgi:hypothetical protein